MIEYQILQIDKIRIVWQTVRRIINEIMGVKGLIISVMLNVWQFVKLQNWVGFAEVKLLNQPSL